MSLTALRVMRWVGSTVGILGILGVVLYFVTGTNDLPLLLTAFIVAMVGGAILDVGLIFG